MKMAPALAARLEFLSRVMSKECQYLLDTDGRLFASAFTLEQAQRIALDPMLAERIDAFVSYKQPQGRLCGRWHGFGAGQAITALH